MKTWVRCTTQSHLHYFVHPIFEHNHQQSDMHDVLSTFYTTIGMRALIRVRALLYMNQGRQIVHSPHIDMHYSHKAALFYMNDNDGFTLMAHEGVDINAYQDKEFKSPIKFTRKDNDLHAKSPVTMSFLVFRKKHRISLGLFPA